MAHTLSIPIPGADAIFALCIAFISSWILLSGLDDLIVVAGLLWSNLSGRGPGCRSSLRRIRAAPEKPIAVFVPLWSEAAVIGRMVEHNLSWVHYLNFDFFLGAYPNDEPTLAAIRDLEERYDNVHLALCPHDGPTSKADCLNWIYQRMLLFEESSGRSFDVIVTHDAEDVIHPESLRFINFYADRYDMIQVPVLPLPTPLGELVHGAYCDEFAEYQTKDIPARQALGGFIPSNGVGTGYARAALEALAGADANRIFEPGCLTEDYENGYRLHRLGLRQLFVPLAFLGGVPVATREYFPRTFRAAVKQRTRWVTGIALQGWERHGWGGSWKEIYWWWRDRKGLVGNPVSALTNAGGLLVLAGGWPAPVPDFVLYGALLMQCVFLAFRICAVGRLYGWLFALGVPLRTVVSNVINALAVVLALKQYLAARLRGEPLVWLKTDHSYPTRAALLALTPPELLPARSAASTA